MPQNIPLSYRLFFLYIEPLSALIGAYYAALLPNLYLDYLSLPSFSTAAATLGDGPQVKMSLWQLSNLYLLFAFNEHLVLSSSSSLKTWRRLLFCLLIADFGHLITMSPLGMGAFWRVWEWNAMLWGSVGFVYLGAGMRICFLLDFGLSRHTTSADGSRAKRKS